MLNKLTLNLIRENAPISRTSLSKMLGLSKASITGVIKDLLAKEIIEETGLENSSGGRKPVTLKIKANSGYAVGIDVGSLNMRIIITDLETKVIASEICKTEANLGQQHVLNKIIEKIKLIIRNSNIEQHKIKGIGISISAIVNGNGTIFTCPNMPGWENIELKKIISEKFKMKTFLDDSSRLKTLAEAKFGHQAVAPTELGHAKGIKNFLYVDIGVGVGSGIFIDGKIYKGEHNLAGEIGHQTVEENGVICGCGNRGCLETVASGSAIVKRTIKSLEDGVVSSLDKNNLSPETIVETANNKDKLAFNIITKTGEYIGIAVANAVNFLNPAMVVIGGGLSKSGEILFEPIKRIIRERTLQQTYKNLEIKLSSLPDTSAALGASSLVIDDFFDNFFNE